MIEKGLAPAPEADPGQFERMMDWHPSQSYGPRAHKSRRTGIIVLAVGLGLSIQGYFGSGAVGMNAQAGATAGVLLIFIGVGFIVVSMFEARATQSGPHPPQENQ